MAGAQVKTWLAPVLAQRRRLRRWRRQLVIIFAVIGPGLITATVNQDAGGIYTYSLAGAQFGYLLLWTVLPIALALYITQECPPGWAWPPARASPTWCGRSSASALRSS